MKNFKRTISDIETYRDSLNMLHELEVIRNQKDFTCQLGEWLVAQIYDGIIAKSGIQRDWDIEAKKGLIQVKSHAKSLSTSARWSPIKRDSEKVDYLAIVIFTPRYKLKEFYLAPWREVLTSVSCQKHRNVINWSRMSDSKIPLNKLPKQDLIQAFV